MRPPQTTQLTRARARAQPSAAGVKRPRETDTILPANGRPGPAAGSSGLFLEAQPWSPCSRPELALPTGHGHSPGGSLRLPGAPGAQHPGAGPAWAPAEERNLDTHRGRPGRAKALLTHHGRRPARWTPQDWGDGAVHHEQDTCGNGGRLRVGTPSGLPASPGSTGRGLSCGTGGEDLGGSQHPTKSSRPKGHTQAHGAADRPLGPRLKRRQASQRYQTPGDSICYVRQQ